MAARIHSDEGARPNGPPAAMRRVGGRRWSGLVGLVLALLAIGGLAVASVSTVSLRAETAREDIQARLAELTGLPVEAGGEAGFTLLPRTRISLTKVRIGAAQGDSDAVMAIDGIVAELDLWQALLGRTSIEKLELIRPELLSTAGFVEDSTPRRTSAADDTQGLGAIVSPAAAADETAVRGRPGYLQMSRYFGAFLSRFGDLRSLEIRDGVFRMAPGGGTAVGIGNANITVSWPSKTSAARLRGSYVWNGQPTEIDLSLAAPLDFLRGDRSTVEFDMTSPVVSAGFEGEGALGGDGHFTGRLRVAAPSLTRTIRWLGDPRAALPDIGPLSIEASLEAIGNRLNLRNATVTLDGFAGDGAMEMLVGADGKPSIGGTLAFDRLDLTGFAQAVAPLPQNPLDLQRRIPVDFVDRIDLDIRLSAAEAGIGTIPVSDLAATLKLKEGTATLDIGDASVLGGNGRLRISVDSRVRNPIARGTASLSGIDTPALFTAIGVSSVGLSGLSDIKAEVEVPVTNWTDIFKRNTMTLNVATRSGALNGFDPKVFLSQGTKPFALATEATTIPFQTMKATLKSVGPLVDVTDVVLAGPSGAFEASGVFSTATRQVDIAGSFTPYPAAGSTTGTEAAASGGAMPVGFRMEGEWPNPTVTSGPPRRPI